jgi:hypothetical protein
VRLTWESVRIEAPSRPQRKFAEGTQPALIDVGVAEEGPGAERVMRMQ